MASQIPLRVLDVLHERGAGVPIGGRWLIWDAAEHRVLNEPVSNAIWDAAKQRVPNEPVPNAIWDAAKRLILNEPVPNGIWYPSGHPGRHLVRAHSRGAVGMPRRIHRHFNNEAMP
jgi:hypothetical protein